MSWRALARSRGGELMMATVVLAVVAMIVVPLPTPLIDLLISLNLASAVLLLAAVLFTRDALAFSTFPTLLLLSTLLRLSLNVSSSRLILLDADAGRIIAAFGHVVVRGDYAVGALLFVVITVVQLIVVVKGGERVAEVSARFSLDALPGRQLAIDAELRAGTLSPAEARAERTRLADESHLFGALDGAMKLVRGDALAGLVITFVNLLGGVGIGLLERGLSLTESLAKYGVLTIGDGLVTQIPSMLSATAAALIVTRARAQRPLAEELRHQLFSDARALSTAAAVLCALALVPGLPLWPPLLVGLSCALGALHISRTKPATPRFVEQATARVVITLSPQLYAQLGAENAQAVRNELEHTQHGTLAALGFSAGAPELCLQVGLEAATAGLWLDGTELARAAIPEATPRAIGAALAASLERLLRAHAHELLSLEAVSTLVREIEARAPALARHAFPKPVSVQRLQQIARRLLAEGLSIRPLEELVEALLHTEPDGSHEEVTEAVRTVLRRRVSAHAAPAGQLHMLRLAPELVEALEDALFEDGGRPALALEPGLCTEIREAIQRAADQVHGPRALVVDARLRRHVAELVASFPRSLAVLKPSELASELVVTKTTLISP